MSARKEFGVETMSRIDELYGASIDNVINKNASLNLYGQQISFSDLQNGMKKQPFMSTMPKSNLLEINEMDKDAFKKTKKCIERVPKSVETVVMEIVKVQDFPNVKYYPAEARLVDGKICYMSPRFNIDLSDQIIKPHEGVRINTGYSIRIPSITMGRTIKESTFAETKVGRQLDYVIVPMIWSKTQNVIQAVYARDPEDSGLLTINFTTTKETNFKEKLQVVLFAFSTTRPLMEANIINGLAGSPDLFKPKDSRTGRLVKNPKIKFHADSFDVTTKPGSVILKTFDNNSTPIVTHEKQKIKIDNIITLFTSRKREWCNPNLVTVAGIFNPTQSKNNIAPIVVKGSEVTNNTHCMVFLKNKVTLFDVSSEMDEDVRLINGAFSNLENYDNIIRKLRQLVTALFGLSVGAEICRKISTNNEKLDERRLLRLYDYHRSINENDRRLVEKSNYNDEQMFDERPSMSNAYSVNLYKAFKYLAYVFTPERFTTEQLEELSLSSSTAANTNRIAENEIHLEQNETLNGDKVNENVQNNNCDNLPNNGIADGENIPTENGKVNDDINDEQQDEQPCNSDEKKEDPQQNDQQCNTNNKKRPLENNNTPECSSLKKSKN